MLQYFVTVMHTRDLSSTSRLIEPEFDGNSNYSWSGPAVASVRRALALLLTLQLGVMLISSSAQASDYLIEVIVFKWKAGPAVEETFASESGADNVPASARATPNNLVQQVRPSLLVNAANGMQSAGAVDVLEHIGWTQSRAGQSGSPQMDMGAAAGSNLTGWVRLYTNTYLFAEIDLAMRDDTGQLIRLKQRRRVKFNEVHYFDHPKFGVVVTISPNKS